MKPKTIAVLAIMALAAPLFADTAEQMADQARQPFGESGQMQAVSDRACGLWHPSSAEAAQLRMERIERRIDMRLDRQQQEQEQTAVEAPVMVEKNPSVSKTVGTRNLPSALKQGGWIGGLAGGVLGAVTGGVVGGVLGGGLWAFGGAALGLVGGGLAGIGLGIFLAWLLG
ncbi:MAG: hypothetical protein HY747_08425 [Elusimicrobia bacterium]|nr:hypothetical protein [Elusimicrobiota bacterium]